MDTTVNTKTADQRIGDQFRSILTGDEVDIVGDKKTDGIMLRAW
jgi:hypothetical protein